MKRWRGVVAALAFSTLTDPAPDAAWGDEFKRGTIVVTPQFGGGINNNMEGHRRFTIIPQVNGTLRLSLFPLDPVGSGFWRGSLETGFEPWFQYYPRQKATAEGLKLDFRYHFLGAFPISPYVEVLAGAGGTSLNVREIRSDFTAVLEAGVGLSYFVAEGVALTAGYRFQHISNGGIESPNQGINSDTGVAGVAFFFH